MDKSCADSLALVGALSPQPRNSRRLNCRNLWSLIDRTSISMGGRPWLETGADRSQAMDTKGEGKDALCSKLL